METKNKALALALMALLCVPQAGAAMYYIDGQWVENLTNQAHGLMDWVQECVPGGSSTPKQEQADQPKPATTRRRRRRVHTPEQKQLTRKQKQRAKVINEVLGHCDSATELLDRLKGDPEIMRLTGQLARAISKRMKMKRKLPPHVAPLLLQLCKDVLADINPVLEQAACNGEFKLADFNALKTAGRKAALRHKKKLLHEMRMYALVGNKRK